MSWAIHTGDVLEVLPSLEAGSFDAVLSDPPYGLSFMGKAWDHGVPGEPVWAEVLRLLRPGAMVLAFGGTRTFHRLAVGIEDAGFEIRDCLSWLYGSGFPKSLDISKAIDKVAGVEGSLGAPKSAAHAGWIERGRMRGESGHDGYQRPWMQDAEKVEANARQYLPGSDSARLWSGYGTALKPAHEVCIMAQKAPDLVGLCGIVAHKITGAICQLAKDAERSSESSPPGSSGAFDSARWRAVSECSTPGGLFDLTATWPSGLEIPSSLNTALSWLGTLAEALKLSNTFTTETASSLTTDLKTLNCSPSPITPAAIIEASSPTSGIGSSASLAGVTFAAVAHRLALIRARSVAESATSPDGESGLPPNQRLVAVAMKPLDGTFAENALAHGVAGLNVDGGRILISDSGGHWGSGKSDGSCWSPGRTNGASCPEGQRHTLGRWPANVLLDEAAAERLDGEVGELKSGGGRKSWRTSDGWAGGALGPLPGESAADSGGPSRFFYCAKASRREREAGLEGFESRSAAERTGRADGSAGLHTSARPNVEGGNPYAGQSSGRARNHHPTVKPVALCEYLARLILPPDTGRPRRLLVPFAGSGSEMIGALRAGWDEVVGIELDPEYVAIAEARLRHWASDEHLPAGEDATPGGPEQIALFDLEAASA